MKCTIWSGHIAVHDEIGIILTNSRVEDARVVRPNLRAIKTRVVLSDLRVVEASWPTSLVGIKYLTTSKVGIAKVS